MRNHSELPKASAEILYPTTKGSEQSMSTEQTPTPLSASLLHQLNFAPLHRTDELENIHAQVTQNDFGQQQEQGQAQSQPQAQSQTPTRKVLTKHMTVIGDGNDIDIRKIPLQ